MALADREFGRELRFRIPGKSHPNKLLYVKRHSLELVGWWYKFVGNCLGVVYLQTTH